MSCPPGYIEINKKCVPIGIDRQRSEQSKNPNTRTIALSEYFPKPSDQKYDKLNRVGEIIADAWYNRPDSPKWIKNVINASPIQTGIEVAEELVTLQFKAAEKIASGDLAGAEQYSQIERERVESLGFKPIWTPGGFQV